MEANTNNVIARDELKAVIRRQIRSRRQYEHERVVRFQKVREKLRASILGAFRRDEWPRLCQINDAFTKECGLPVPSLSICGQGTAEIRYTKLLSWYLDSVNPHGLGSLLSEALFSDYFPESESKPGFKGCRSNAEIDLGAVPLKSGDMKYNSLDVMVCADDWIICIEQKILSSEGRDQLGNYSRALDKKFSNQKRLCFYLTPEGKAGSNDEWIPISHLDILKSFAHVLRSVALYPTARHNLKALCWELMLGPIAKDDSWISEFKTQVAAVSKNPERYYAGFSKWLAGQGIEPEQRRIILTIAET